MGNSLSLSLLEQVSNPFTHYHLSNHTLAHEKDGQQMLSVGIIAAERLALQGGEIAVIAPRLASDYTAWVVAAPAVILTLATPYAKKYLTPPADSPPRVDNLQTKFFTNLSKVVLMANDVAIVAYQHVDIVLNTASCVSYVAMIALGMPIGGGLGLACLALLALKRYQHLPENLQWLPGALDVYMTPLGLIGEFTAAIVNPMHIIFRLFILYATVSEMSRYIIQTPQIKNRLPEWLTNPLIASHRLSNIDWEWLGGRLPTFTWPSLAASAELTNQRLEDFKKQLSETFVVNPSYIYAEEVGRLIPPELLANRSSTEELFTELEKRLQTQNEVSQEEQKLTAEQEADLKERSQALIPVDPWQRYGLERIKQGAIHGKVDDLLPVNVDKFKEVLKALVQSILDDPNPADKIYALAAVGHSCVEGWAREVEYILNPSSKDIKWQVHYELSKMRGGCLKKWVTGYSKVLHEKYGISFESLGGANNVHLTSALQAGFWHRFRTYEGELMIQLMPHSIFGSLFLNTMVNPVHYNFPELLYIIENILSEHPEFFPLAGNLKEVISVIDKHFAESGPIITSIYEAIKPTVVQENGKEIRGISWEAIQSWIATMEDKGIKFFSETEDDEGKVTGVWNKEWVEWVELEWGEIGKERSKRRLPTLTIKGVCALLMDMSIIESNVA